jgi:hypothetical protein
LVESLQESNCRVEHVGLRLVLGHALADDGEGCTSRSNRLEAPQDAVERAIDRHTLQMSELTTPRTVVRIHEHVRLKRTAEPALALSSATREGGDLAVVFG